MDLAEKLETIAAQPEPRPTGPHLRRHLRGVTDRDCRRWVRRSKRDARRALDVWVMAKARQCDPDVTWRTVAERLGIARSTLCASVSYRRFLEYGEWAAAEWWHGVRNDAPLSRWAGVRVARHFVMH